MTTALTPSDIRTMARKAADYITFHCDGLSRGFEITHKGYSLHQLRGEDVQRREARPRAGAGGLGR